MQYLADTNGYIGDFGNMDIIDNFSEIAKKFKLKELLFFFENGFSLDKEKLLEDLNSVDFAFTELADVAVDIISSIEKADEIVILTDNL